MKFQSPPRFLPAEQPKKIEKAPVWELTDRYGDVAKLHDLAIEIAAKVAKSPEDKDERAYLEELNEQLVNAIDKIRENLDFQEEHDLIKHKWALGMKPFEEALEKGTKALEMDIRTTKDGKTIIAHSFKTKKSVFEKGEVIHEKTLDELKKKYPDITSVRQIFEHFLKYSKDHELILELKDINAVDEVVELVKEFDLKKSIRVASLSPAILEAVHKKLPDINGFILNGGIVPFITTPLAKNPDTKRKSKLEKFVLKDGMGWKAAEMGSLQVIFGADSFPNPKQAKSKEEGLGKNLGYAFFRIPDKLKEILKGDKDAISLSSVLIASNIISLFSKTTGEYMLKSYKALTDKLGLKTMATTWMETLGKGITSLKPENQFKILKEIGIDTIYTKEPVELTKKIKDME